MVSPEGEAGAPLYLSSGCPDKLWRSSSTRSCHLLLVAICARWLRDCAQAISVPQQSTCSALSGEMQTYTSINHPEAVFDFKSSPITTVTVILAVPPCSVSAVLPTCKQNFRLQGSVSEKWFLVHSCKFATLVQ